MTTKGPAAPEGYLWGRDPSGCWHVLRSAELTDAGGDYRRWVRSACGDWRSVTPWTPGRWAEITSWPPAGAPPWMCSSCLRDVAQAERAVRAAQAPAAEQGRLFEDL